MMEGEIRVSVVMATYNGERFIRQQLDSILAQTYPVSEIIVRDDCSTDSTIYIIKEYARACEKIRLFQNERNVGLNENFRLAVKEATGHFIAISDQDDVWFPQKIERQLQAIGRHAMCYAPHLRGSDMEHARLVDYKNAPEMRLFKAIVGHSMLLRADFAQQESSWPGFLTYDIWLSALADYFAEGVVRVEEPLNFHRSHEGQASLNIFSKGPSAKKSAAPTWQPYVFGWRNYFRLQRSEGWQRFYTRIESESRGRNALTNKIARLLLSPNPLALLRLCLVCLKHRHTIYPSARTSGLMGAVRAFAYPLIHTYNCDFYEPKN